MERRGATGAIAASPSPARRQQAFPACALESLEQVTKFCGHQSQKWRAPAAVRNTELQHLLDNDLFCVSSHRRDSRLTPTQQFHLIGILCDYFNVKPRGHQYSYFEVIFCGREGEALLHDVRIALLMNLCSLAVQYPCYSLLNHVSQWLHKHRFLMPLADEVPEFVSYFVAYSVTEVTIRSSLIEVLAHWLTSTQSSRIIAFIKETPTITKYFATNTFWLLVLYDCTSGCGQRSPLHGVTTMLYAEWAKTPPLNIKPALEALISEDQETKFEPIVLYYHLHFARLSNCLSRKELAELLPRIHLGDNYQTLLESLR
ncbi:unnamed protein product [Toxocara canis]|uniref:Centromere protein I n=1 Tax=Toxocara canis TaxID=6265 RepID=A0A183UJE1_TOXCA|nr:unnamed protein product [Toxocara canis]